MIRDSLKLVGRMISINAADQSFLIESGTKSNRRYVYANDALFKKLNRLLTVSQFNGEKGKEKIYTFYTQGKVLMTFEPSAGKRFGSLEAIKAWVERGDRS